MAAQIVKLSDEELATCKLRDITNVVKGKFTEEDIKALKEAGNDEKARRDLVVSFYKKYIDQVIEESKETPAADAANDKDDKDEKPSDTPSTSSANSETEAKDVNINVYFTVSVKGVTGYSGTITCSCEHLLKVAFLNPKSAIIEFRTKERAKQFIDIVKKVTHVKGLSSLPETTRAIIINRIKENNEL
jgi:ribosomal protein L12E/L44/L45/RPP1/RPP2